MNITEQENKRGTTKECTECGKTIPKNSRSMCEDCRIEEENKNNKPLAKYPTNAPPGSDRKILVLSWRAYTGHSLWHPRDYNPKDMFTNTYFRYTPAQQEYEDNILKEINKILQELEIKRQKEFEIKKAILQERRENLKLQKDIS